MKLHQIAQEFNSFFEDKQLILNFLSRIKQGKELPSETAAQITEIEEKWKDDATLYRSIKQEIAGVKDHLHHQQSQTQLISAPLARENFIPTPASPRRESFMSLVSPYRDTADISYQLPAHTPYNITPDHNLTQDIHQFFDAQGIVGEERMRELLMYAVVARANIGIESLAGSGKSAVLQTLLKAIPAKRYLIINQGTLASLYHNQSGNTVDYWIIPELQKIFSKNIEEVIKNLTEGASITYSKTNAQRDGVETMSISKKAVLYSLAITNKHLKERDDEFYRRFIIFHTDIRKEQNRNVAARYAQQDFAEESTKRAVEFIPQHLAKILEADTEVKNPYLPVLIDSFPAEIAGHIRFRSSVKYFQSLVKGYTLFHASENHTSEKRYKKDTLFSTFDDNRAVISLYFDTLRSNLFGLNVVDEGLLEIMPENPVSYNRLNDLFCDQYSSQYDLEESVAKLRTLNLVDYAGGSYTRKSLPELNLDEEKLFQAADNLMKKHYPGQHESWRQAHETEEGF